MPIIDKGPNEKLGGSANTRSNIIPALREVQYPGSHASGKAFYLNLYIYYCSIILIYYSPLGPVGSIDDQQTESL